MTDTSAISTFTSPPIAHISTARSTPNSTPRVRRAVMTWLAGAFYTAVTLAVGFITTPLLIRYLGSDRLGASRAATEWMGYLALADLGLGSAVGVMLLRARGKR